MSLKSLGFFLPYLNSFKLNFLYLKKANTMKKLLFILLFIPSIIFSQIIKKESSSIRNSIDNAEIHRINKDWTTIAEFKSGIGETVEFFPIEFINLKSKKVTNALQLDMKIKQSTNLLKGDFLLKTAYIGIEEIDEFILFIEKYVIPNLDLKFKDKSSEFTFKAKEMTLTYFIYEKKRRLTIKLNDYDNDKIKNYTFWTQTQVSKISNLLDILKNLK